MLEQFTMPERKEKEPSFKELVEDFESKYPLADLHAIINLNAGEAPFHPLREPARLALITILQMASTEEEKNTYKRLSNAVGIINNGVVDHTRNKISK